MPVMVTDNTRANGLEIIDEAAILLGTVGWVKSGKNQILELDQYLFQHNSIAT